jgi:hypothetical protein
MGHAFHPSPFVASLNNKPMVIPTLVLLAHFLSSVSFFPDGSVLVYPTVALLTETATRPKC